jgi:hypothetical protein
MFDDGPNYFNIVKFLVIYVLIDINENHIAKYRWILKKE